MARLARYVPDNKSFQEFMLSQQARRPVREIAMAIAAEASATDDSSIAADYKVAKGPDAVVAGNPRLTERVVNDNEKAAALEFGSGLENEGGTGPNDRPQGGYSPARRHLGYIAAGYHSAIGEPG